MALIKTTLNKPTVATAENLQAQKTALTDSSALLSKTVVDGQLSLLDSQSTLQRQQELATTNDLVVQKPAIVVAPSLTRADLNQASDKLLDAIRFSHDLWKAQAYFRNIIINGSTAIGMPMCLTGPELVPMIKMSPTLNDLRLSGDAKDQQIISIFDAIAEGVSENFELYQNAVTVPGLPWFPTFVAYPGPMAPPTPNMPMPLIVCASYCMTNITGSTNLKQVILEKLSAVERTEVVDTFIEDVSVVISSGFSLWIAAAMVQLVMGYGPVPTFAPPYVPVGPVINGSVIPAPGHLMTSGSLSFPLKAMYLS